jgi:hypothetical protein
MQPGQYTRSYEGAGILRKGQVGRSRQRSFGGTTAVAVPETGRSLIGIELSEVYVSLAAGKVRNHGRIQ